MRVSRSTAGTIGALLAAAAIPLLPIFQQEDFMKTQFAAGLVVLGLALAPAAFAADKASDTKAAPAKTARTQKRK